MNEEVDILILGLGPAGACAAETCAMAGLSVLAIDKKAIPGSPVQCAEFVPAMIGSEVDALHKTTVQNIQSMQTFVEDQPADIMADFPGKMIDRQNFDKQLGLQATKAGAQLDYGVKAQDISTGADVVLSDGRLVSAKVLIGADGPKSLVGYGMGSSNIDFLETRQIEVPLLRPFDSTDIFLQNSIVGGYGWAFPKGAMLNIGLGVHPDHRKKLKPLLDDLHQKLILEGRAGEKIISHTGGLIPAGGMIKPWRIVGPTLCLLAGDAAGLTNPITGAGINSAVISGKLAAQTAVSYLANDYDLKTAEDYQEDLEDLLGPSLNRAIAHKKRLTKLQKEQHKLDPEQLRDGWIAYPKYWTPQSPPKMENQSCPV